MGKFLSATVARGFRGLILYSILIIMDTVMGDLYSVAVFTMQGTALGQQFDAQGMPKLPGMPQGDQCSIM